MRGIHSRTVVNATFNMGDNPGATLRSYKLGEQPKEADPRRQHFHAPVAGRGER
jgi:hypothetical protein